MKSINQITLFGVALLAGMLLAVGLSSCQDNAALRQELNNFNGQIHDLQNQVHAATQPQVIVPGTDTQPAVVLPPVVLPPKVVKGVDQFATNVSHATDVVNTLPPDANPGQVVQIVAPFLPEPYRSYVGLAGFAGSIIFALIKGRQAKQSDQAKVQSDLALTSTADSLQNALAHGAITLTDKAPAMVNALIMDHPGTDPIVDVLSDAAKTPRIA